MCEWQSLQFSIHSTVQAHNSTKSSTALCLNGIQALTHNRMYPYVLEALSLNPGSSREVRSQWLCREPFSSHHPLMTSHNPEWALFINLGPSTVWSHTLILPRKISERSQASQHGSNLLAQSQSEVSQEQLEEFPYCLSQTLTSTRAALFIQETLSSGCLYGKTDSEVGTTASSATWIPLQVSCTV